MRNTGGGQANTGDYAFIDPKAYMDVVKSTHPFGHGISSPFCVLLSPHFLGTREFTTTRDVLPCTHREMLDILFKADDMVWINGKQAPRLRCTGATR